MALVSVTYHPRLHAVRINRTDVGEIEHALPQDEPPMVCFSNGLVLQWDGVMWKAVLNPQGITVITSRNLNRVGFTTVAVLWVVVGTKELI